MEMYFCTISLDLPEVGFEPTLPKKTELKSAALDHSAIQAHDCAQAKVSRWFSWDEVSTLNNVVAASHSIDILSREFSKI